MEIKEHASKALKHMGKLMECVEELSGKARMGERGGNYGNRGGYGGDFGSRSGYREDADWTDDDERLFQRMGERRERSSRTGRFIRG